MRDERIRFSPASPLSRDLKARVDAHFKETGASPHGGPSLWLKTFLLALLTATPVVLFVLGSGVWWQAVICGVVAGLGIAGLGFCVQHDASHGAYSRRKSVNKMMTAVLDMIGGSSHVWRVKHNQMHHSYPNLANVDPDIDAGIFGRLAPGIRRRAIHRYQHIYLWALYSMLTLKWVWFDDYWNIAHGTLGSHRLPRPKGKQWALFFAGKLFTIAWTLVIPMLAHGVWMGLLFHLSLHATAGFVLSMVFQLAHVVDGAEFPAVPTPPGEAYDFAELQLQTSVDFARKSPLITWYVGGLNFQAIHHLFPRICHIHYPALSPIVEEVCREHGVEYRTRPSLAAAIKAHYRFIYAMGRAPDVAKPAEAA